MNSSKPRTRGALDYYERLEENLGMEVIAVTGYALLNLKEEPC
jgi:hypothetical protein